MSNGAKRRAVDFSGVQDRSPVNPKHVPSGDYLAQAISVTESESNAGNEQWVYVFSLVNYKKGGTYPYYCQLDDNLWKLRNLIMATGADVPKKKVNVDPNKYLKKEVGITLGDDEYEGRMKSVITNVFPAEDVEEEPEEEEPVVQAESRTRSSRTTKAAPTRRGSLRRKAVADDDEGEEVGDEEMEALELDEL